MTKGGALPKGFERPSDLSLQEKYEEVKSSSKTITLRISKFNPEKDNTSCTIFVQTGNMWFMWNDH